MKTLRLMALISVVSFLLASSQIAHAGGGTPPPSPWSEILNPDGSIRWAALVDLGTTSQAANWMEIPLPGGTVMKLDATYHRYQTPSGNIVVLPSPTTLFLMAMHPTESGLTSAQSMLGDGASILAMLLGPLLSTDQLAKLISKGYTDPKAFFQAVINGKENIWSIVNPTFLFEVLKMSFDSGFIVNALLLYLNGAANCANIPGACAGLLTHCTGSNCLPPPSGSVCPTPTIVQGLPTLIIQKVAPDHVLVVGQDPGKRGADIQASVSIPPVVFTWYEPVQDLPTCQFDSTGNGHGCAGPANRYAHVIGQDGSPVSWNSTLENNASWKVVDGAIHCIQHVEVLPEAITSLQATAQLNAQSQAWILNDLAGKYYQAYLHQPFFNLVPEMAQMSNGCGGDLTCAAKALVPNVPFADPGTFDLKLWATTGGTSFTWKGVTLPITQPRVMTAQNSMQVYVTLVSLLPAGAP